MNSYDILGRITALTRPDGIREMISSYNDAGELIQQADASGSEVNFTYDFAGRRTSAKTNGVASQNYEYDALGNIIGIKDGNSNVTQYQLDKWGKIVSIVRADEIIEEYVIAYEYDLNGNKTRQTDITGKATECRYNKLNQLIEVYDREPNADNKGKSFDINK